MAPPDYENLGTTLISKDDMYVWVDFKKQMEKEVFKNLECMLETFLKYYPRVLVRIEAGQGFFLKKDTQDLKMSQVLVPNIKAKFLQKVIRPSGKVAIDEMHMKLLTIIGQDEVAGKLDMYSNMCYKPRDHDLKRLEYNNWDEFVGVDIDNMEDDGMADELDMENLDVLLKFLKDIICNGDEECYKYMLSWLGNIVTCPWKKTGVCIFLQSVQGCGKGVFASFLKNCVFL